MLSAINAIASLFSGITLFTLAHCIVINYKTTPLQVDSMVILMSLSYFIFKRDMIIALRLFKDWTDLLALQETVVCSL